MPRMDDTMLAVTLVAVAAAMLPTTLAASCDSLYQASFDCGLGYVYSGRASEPCNDGSEPCDAFIGGYDHAVCCMVCPPPPLITYPPPPGKHYRLQVQYACVNKV